MKHYQNGQLSIAGIHATILSILIALISAYSFHVHSVIQEMELEVINTAHKINKIPFLRYAYLPPYDFSLPKDANETIEKFIYMYLLLSLPSNSDISKVYEIPEEQSKRAEKAIQLMNVIAHRYPFPKALLKTNGSWSRIRPKPLVFGDMNDVSNWLLYLNKILESTGLFRHIPDQFLSGKYLEYFESLEKTKEEDIKNSRNDVLLQINGELRPKNIFSNFIGGLNRAEAIALETEYKIEKSEQYRKNHLSRNSVRFGISSAGIVFFLSVMVPVLFKSASRIFWTIIPSVYYLFIFVYFLIKSF